jgi:hypothetical protein
MSLIQIVVGSTREGRSASLDPKLDKLADDLAWWAATLAAGRAAQA